MHSFDVAICGPGALSPVEASALQPRLRLFVMRPSNCGRAKEHIMWEPAFAAHPFPPHRQKHGSSPDDARPAKSHRRMWPSNLQPTIRNHTQLPGLNRWPILAVLTSRCVLRPAAPLHRVLKCSWAKTGWPSHQIQVNRRLP